MNKRNLRKLNIKSLEHLALQLGYPRKKLLKVCSNISKYYRSRDRLIKGKNRHIDEPVFDLRCILDKLQELLSRIELPDYIQGGRKGFSIIKNAEPHLGKAAVLKFDLEDFFPSIHCTRVYNLFIDLGCSWRVGSVLTRLTTYGGCVPHGSPTSTVIANLCILPLAKRIRKLAESHICDYNQFVDDGAMSGRVYIEKLRPLIERIIKQMGFRASTKPQKRKTLYWYEEQVVCGVKVNKKITVPAGTFRTVEEEIKFFKQDITKGKKCFEKDARSLRGKIQHIKNLDKEKGIKLQQKFNDIIKKIPQH